MRYIRNVVPTPSLALNYTLGVGGFPRDAGVEVFGPPEIGKTSALGYGTLANAQKMGLICGIIAVEPEFVPEWAQDNGVDLSTVIIGYPDNGEEAFEMLRDWVYGGVIQYVLFDSIGALSSESENTTDGNKKAFGQAGLITWGVKRVMPRAKKNGVGILFINQQRDDNKSRIAGLVESPGGWALKHAMLIRIHLKPGKDRWVVKIDGEDKIVGQQLVAKVKKNKAAEGNGNTARFNYFNTHTDEYPFGVDEIEDILATAKRAGVIEGAGAWLRHDLFPDGKLNGKAAASTFFAEHPDVTETIRKQVLEVALRDQENARRKRLEKEAKATTAREVMDGDDDGS